MNKIKTDKLSLKIQIELESWEMRKSFMKFLIFLKFQKTSNMLHDDHQLNEQFVLSNLKFNLIACWTFDSRTKDKIDFRLILSSLSNKIQSRQLHTRSLIKNYTRSRE